MAEYVGCRYVVGLSCGTASLHLVIKLAGETLYGQARPNQGMLQGHRVFCDDVTFDASINPVAYDDAVDPLEEKYRLNGNWVEICTLGDYNCIFFNGNNVFQPVMEAA